METERGMDDYDMVLSVIDAAGGEIRGRTAIQKLVYLAGRVHPEIGAPAYEPHYYGPFSSELAAVLRKLVSYSFVSEGRIPGMVIEGYSYRLTDDGKDLVEKVRKDDGESCQKIQEVVNRCKASCKLSIPTLSVASKIYYMLTMRQDKDQRISKKEAIEGARKLGWEVDEGSIDDGVELLEALELVRVG